jgi:hypothetical protein
MLVEHCTAEINLWLDGLDSQSPELGRRVNSAGGFFISLCEVLLVTEPARGAQLWHFLDKYLRIRYVGIGGVSYLKHLAFKVGENTATASLKSHLYGLAANTNDRSYLELATCALVNGKRNWLWEKVRGDEQSHVDWRRKRAILVGGYAADPASSLQTFEGPCDDSWATQRRQAIQRSNMQAMAFYWWLAFLNAKTVEETFAAWQLFVHYADSRVYAWMDEGLVSPRGDEELWRLKVASVEVNNSQLESAIKDNEARSNNDLTKRLLGLDPPTRWLAMSQLPLQ